MFRSTGPAKITRQILPRMVVSACLMAAAVLSGRVAAAADIAPHTAHYTMKLLSARAGSNIETAAGNIVVRWERDCAGWSMTNRTVFDIGYGGGENVGFTIDAATWEAAAGDSYTFLVRTEYAGREVERVEGSASIKGNRRFADFVQPSERRLLLPPGTVFPMKHTEMVLAAARSGTRFVRATVFDGFTDEGAQFVNAIAGPRKPPADAIVEKFPALRKLATWNLSLAFFPGDEAAGEPDSEISMNMTENGIAAWMDMDFGDFKLRGELERLQVGERPRCK